MLTVTVKGGLAIKKKGNVGGGIQVSWKEGIEP